MFGAVMCDEEICKEFLEMVLQIPIERVEVSKEKSIVYHPEYKGVRLDVIAADEKRTHYNVEMQVLRKKQRRKHRMLPNLLLKPKNRRPYTARRCSLPEN